MKKRLHSDNTPKRPSSSTLRHSQALETAPNPGGFLATQTLFKRPKSYEFLFQITLCY